MKPDSRLTLIVVLLVATASSALPVTIDLSGARTGTLITVPGGRLAQIFSGQGLAGTGLKGSPCGPLCLEGSESLLVEYFNGCHTILPQPDNTAPLAVLLDQVADSISWTMGYADLPGCINIDFFAADGSLAHSVVQPLVVNYSVYTFSGFGEFKGVSIYNNNDPAGLRYYNFSYSVHSPRPHVPDGGGGVVLLGMGLIALAGVRIAGRTAAPA